jgi:N utilization substance protein B
MAGIRRKARELALQVLYQMEITGEPAPTGPESFWGHFPSRPAARDFAQRLIAGTTARRDEIDGFIENAVEHWKLERLSKVDLIILRFATYELLFCPDIPLNVSIDEAIEIGNRYGSDDSSAFINGVLDHVADANGLKDSAKESERPEP